MSLFLFPAMSASERRLVLDLGELLMVMGGRCREHLAMEIRLLQDVARAEGWGGEDSKMIGRGRVLPFRRSS